MSWWTIGSQSDSPSMPILPPIGTVNERRIRISDEDIMVVIPPDEPIFFPDDPGWISEPGMLPPDDTIDWESKWGMLPIEDEEPEGWYPDDPFHFG